MGGNHAGVAPARYCLTEVRASLTLSGAKQRGQAAGEDSSSSSIRQEESKEEESGAQRGERVCSAFTCGMQRRTSRGSSLDYPLDQLLHRRQLPLVHEVELLRAAGRLRGSSVGLGFWDGHAGSGHWELLRAGRWWVGV